MTSHPLRWAATLLLVCAIPNAAAIAQSAQAPVPDAVQPERTLDRLQRDQQRGMAPTLPSVASSSAKADSKPLFKLRSVTFRGAKSVLQGQLEAAASSFIGKQVSAADLSRLTDALTEIYRSAGWHLSRAIIQPQNADGGRLVVSIVEGQIAEVQIRGGQDNATAVRNTLLAVTGEMPSRRETVERSLLLASDLPGVRIAETALEEIGTATGHFRLVVDIQSWKNYTSVSIDNRGTTAVGPGQSYFATNFNSAFAPGDTLGLALSTTPADTEELRFGRVTYSAPIGVDGERISLLALHSQVKPGDFRRQFDTQNRADFAELRGTIAPLRTQNSSLWLSGAVSLGEYAERDLFGRVYADHLRVMTGTAEYQRKDDLGGWNYLTINLKQGLPIFGASTADDPWLSRTDSSGEFTKLEAYFTRVQTLNGPWSLKLSAAGQWASRSLLASQQFYLGAAFARGFYGMEFSGDNAAAGSVELRFDQSVSSDLLKGYQLFGYLDHTAVWNVRKDTNPLRLTLVGAGARLYLPHDLQGVIEVAAPLTYSTPYSQPLKARAFFALSKTFKFCSSPQWAC